MALQRERSGTGERFVRAASLPAGATLGDKDKEEVCRSCRCWLSVCVRLRVCGVRVLVLAWGWGGFASSGRCARRGGAAVLVRAQFTRDRSLWEKEKYQ